MGCNPSKRDIFINTAKQASIIKNIVVEDIQIEKQPFYDFLNEISRNHILEQFKMRNVEINGEFKKMISIVNTLRYKKTLKSLELIKLPDLGDKKGKACLCLIDELPNLERLIFQECDLEDNDQEFISNIISLNKKNLIYFDISGNFFQNRILKLLSSFKNNENFQTIILEKLNIDQFSVDVLLFALQNNNRLKELNLSNNPIKNGIFYFKSFLKHNPNLIKLLLINCNIDDYHLFILFDGLKENKCLLELNLNYNEITSEATNHIKEFFEKNQTLNNLYLLNNKITFKDLEFILHNQDLSKCIVEY
jgi:hypothetical protein